MGKVSKQVIKETIEAFRNEAIKGAIGSGTFAPQGWTRWPAINSKDLTSIWRKITQKENEWSEENEKLMTYDIVMNVYICF